MVEPGKFYEYMHEGTLAKWALTTIHNHIALAEHLGCKPEDLNVDLVQWYEALLAAEDPDGPYAVTLALAQVRHDTVDRADIGHEE